MILLRTHFSGIAVEGKRNSRTFPLPTQPPPQLYKRNSVWLIQCFTSEEGGWRRGRHGGDWEKHLLIFNCQLIWIRNAEQKQENQWRLLHQSLLPCRQLGRHYWPQRWVICDR